MRSLTRPLTAAAITALALTTAACGSSSHNSNATGTTATSTAKASAPAARPVTALAPLTQTQLDAAAVTTNDVAPLKMGVITLTGGESLISSGSIRVAPANPCQALADAWQAGDPEYHASAFTDLKIMEADATVPASHFLHLAAFSGATAKNFVDSVSAAAENCHSYVQPDSDGPIHETVTPIPSSLGDQSAAWYAAMSNSGKTYYAAVTVVRVGSSVITAVELSDSVSSADQLPSTNTALLSAQINKLRSHAA